MGFLFLGDKVTVISVYYFFFFQACVYSHAFCFGNYLRWGEGGLYKQVCDSGVFVGNLWAEREREGEEEGEGERGGWRGRERGRRRRGGGYCGH